MEMERVQDFQQNNVIAADLPKALALLKDLKTNCIKVSETVERLIQQVKDGTISTGKGINFLEVKYHLLLSYLINLTFTMLIKLNGKKLEGDPAIDRIVEIRTVLEKMRPIEQKLRYQIDKLVKTGTTGVVSDKDPLRFAANPDNMLNNFDGDEDGSGDSDAKPSKATNSKVYVPPKLAAMHYDGDLTEQERRQKVVEQARKRALSSSIMQELRQEYYDGPEEIHESRDLHRVKAVKDARDRTRYEEDFMVRLNLSKKEKNKERDLSTMSKLNDLTHFGDINPLNDDMADVDLPKRKKKKFSLGKRKGKKNFKKRRH